MLPVQLLPGVSPSALSSVKPSLQEQEKVPSRLVQVAFPSQSSVPRAHSSTSGTAVKIKHTIMLDPFSPFPGSVGGILSLPATTQKVYQGIEWFSQLAGLQSLTIWSTLIMGITIAFTGDWNTGRLAGLSPIMLCK